MESNLLLIASKYVFLAYPKNEKNRHLLLNLLSQLKKLHLLIHQKEIDLISLKSPSLVWCPFFLGLVGCITVVERRNFADYFKANPGVDQFSLAQNWEITRIVSLENLKIIHHVLAGLSVLCPPKVPASLKVKSLIHLFSSFLLFYKFIIII